MVKIAKRCMFLVLLAGVFAVPAISKETSATGYRFDTEHLILEWDEKPNTTEVKTIAVEAEKYYQRIGKLLVDQPEEKITIVLGGAAERPGQQWEYPRVDSQGRILLFKFTSDFNNYLNALAHEMTHVYRFDRRWTADWFFEEGFAEFVALRVDSSTAGFPWFGYPIDLVAGQWIEKGENIPLTLLQARHRELNLSCGAQSYALRAAFFDWLGHTFGDELVIQAAKQAHAGVLNDYQRFFGKTLIQLELDWQAALLVVYRAIPNVEQRVQKYRLESPIQYQQVCKKGKHF